MTDLDIGMNDWVVPRLTWDGSYTPDRGRVTRNLSRYVPHVILG